MSASSLAKLAVSEADNAEAFVRKVTVAGGNKVAVLAKPNVQGAATGEYLMPGEVADVIARAVSVKDGRVYLRLQMKTGWVTTRSRKDFSKVVIAAVDGPDGNDQPLEPPSAGASLPSRALKLLQHVDEDGKDTEEGSSGATGRLAHEPVKFRASTSRCQILSTPHGRGGNTMSGALLPPKEDFWADAVHYNASEGRAYIRLQDGRGWVCEKLRHNFSKFAVDPTDRTALGADFDETFEDEGPRGAAAGKSSVGLLSRVRARLGDGPGPSKIQSTFAMGPEEVEEPAGPTAKERAEKRKREALAEAAKPVCFRSDSEIWPAPLGEQRAMVPEIRFKLRKVSLDYGARVKEMEGDIREAIERADTYARACDNSRALKAHAEMLQKDVAKVQKEWAKAAEQVIADAQPGELGEVLSVIAKSGGSSPCDRDLWPSLLGALPFLGSEVRSQLRKLYFDYGRRLKDLEDDIREATGFVERPGASAQAGDSGSALRAHAALLRVEVANIPKEWAKSVEEVVAGAAVRAKGGTPAGEAEPPQKKGKTSKSSSEADIQELRKRYEDLYGHPPKGPGQNKADWLQQKIQEQMQANGEPTDADLWHVGPYKAAAEDADEDFRKLRQVAGLKESRETGMMAASAGA